MYTLSNFIEVRLCKFKAKKTVCLLKQKLVYQPIVCHEKSTAFDLGATTNMSFKFGNSIILIL